MEDNLLSPEQGRQLLCLARKILESSLTGGRLVQTPDDPVFSERAATFVTLKIAGNLRGCIGNLTPVGTLWDGIRDNAVNAAFHDHRFPPLQAAELPHLHIDISILSQPRPLEYENGDDLLRKLRPGSATFLPQVWEQLPLPEEFLDHLCQKAGLAKKSWRKKILSIETYLVQCFAEDRP